MKRILSLMLAIIGIVAGSIVAYGFDTNKPIEHAVITEIQTGDLESAGNEFVEIFNQTNKEIDTTNWSLQYKSKTGESWINKYKFSKNILPRSFFLISDDEYLKDLSNDFYKAGLAGSGGHIRIYDETKDEVVDLVAWGEADSPESASAEAPDAGYSLKRLFNEDGLVIDTNDNSKDLIISEVPGPIAMYEAEVKEEGGSGNNTEDDNEATEEGEQEKVDSYLPIIITELYPDPISPETDADDEFVEIYNPNAEPVDIEGYIIKTGDDLNYDYVLPSLSIAAKSYRSIYARDSGLVLANSGGRAVVLDPNQVMLHQAPAYDDAPSGESWAKVDQSWQWTNQVSPHEANKASIDESLEDTSNQSKTTHQINKNYPQILINELFIDPDSPLKDADDEFVEIYNPNTKSVNLLGYKVQTGSTFRYSYTFGDVSIKPKSYLVIFSKSSNLTLANSGGVARTVDPAGNTSHVSSKYEKAPTGTSWARFKSKWSYTYAPTPGSKNILSRDQVLATTADTSSSPAATSAKDVKTEAVEEKVDEPVAIDTDGLTTKIVAGLLGLTLVYGLYEFRYDIKNAIHFAREYSQTWTSDRG